MILVSGYLVLTADNHNMDVQYQRCTYGNGATLFIFQGMGLEVGTFGRTKVPTDSHDTILEIDGLLSVFKVWTSAKKKYISIKEKLILRLTFNLGLALTGFPTTRPW